MQKHVWKYRNVRELGLANLISKRIAEYEWLNPRSITDVRRCKEILLASDYGGNHKNSSYETYAFLIADISNSGEWDERRELFRSKMLTNGRRISFKGIRLPIKHQNPKQFPWSCKLFAWYCCRLCNQ